MEQNMHCTVEASSAAGDVRLVRCTPMHGTAHYRVQVKRLVDKRHATLKQATEHFARALASTIAAKYH